MVKLGLLSRSICIFKRVILKAGTLSFFVFIQPSITSAQLANKPSFTVEELSNKRKIEFKELSIGDMVPEVEFTMLNYPKKKVKLSELMRGKKLLILDYWATWCTSCIKYFPKLDSLQRQYPDIQVLLVNKKSTRDDEAKIQSFLQKRNVINGTAWLLPIAFEDTITENFFPHLLIPHYVIINAEMKVQAITTSDQITAGNIRNILEEKSYNLKIKRDIPSGKPLFLNEQIGLENISNYSTFVKGKIDGLPSGSRTAKQGEIVRGKAYVNTPVFIMYKIAAKQLFSFFNDKRLILDLIDSSKLLLAKNVDTNDWYLRNVCTYEIIIPQTDTAKLYNLILDDLNRFTEYYGRIEKRNVKCFNLTRIFLEDKLKSQGGKAENKLFSKEKPSLKNSPIAKLVVYLNTLDFINIPILDKTDYSSNIDIQFSAPLTNIDTIQNELRRYGLELSVAEREIDMFVLSERKVHKAQ